jgi:lysophospholipase
MQKLMKHSLCTRKKTQVLSRLCNCHVSFIWRTRSLMFFKYAALQQDAASCGPTAIRVKSCLNFMQVEEVPCRENLGRCGDKHAAEQQAMWHIRRGIGAIAAQRRAVPSTFRWLMPDTDIADPSPRETRRFNAKRSPDEAARVPLFPARFLEPPGFVWGSFAAPDGARLRWGHLPAAAPRVECVMVGGFTECIEKYFETTLDLATRGLSVWCLDWRGQGGSERPTRWPTRPRPRRYDRDANDLALFTRTLPPPRRPRLLIAHSMGGAIALLCLRQSPELFDAAILSAPMLGIRTGRMPRTVARCITGAARASGLGLCFIPGAGRWRPDRIPSPEGSRISSDPERCRLQYGWFSARAHLRVDEPTYGWLDEAFRLVKRIRRAEFLGAISTPILLASAGIESFVEPQAHRRAARLLRDCTLVEFPDSKHEPFLELDPIRDRWLGAIDRFVMDRLANGAR